MAMDVIDYEIFGDDIQYMEVELDPGEAAIGEAGAMMMMQDGIEMDTVFGDGSSQSQQSGLMGKLMGAGKRLLTGESLFTTIFHNESNIKRRVAFAAPYPGHIVPIDLSDIGGTLICQKDSFLCAARGVSLGIAINQKLGVGLFGGEGFIMQKLEGDGMAFVHAGGTLAVRDLKPGETLRIDTGCVVGFQPSVNFEIQYVGKLKSQRCSAAKACSLRYCVVRVGCGFNRCRCRVWPIASSGLRLLRVAVPSAKARCSADWVACWMVITADALMFAQGRFVNRPQFLLFVTTMKGDSRIAPTKQCLGTHD